MNYWKTCWAFLIIALFLGAAPIRFLHSQALSATVSDTEPQAEPNLKLLDALTAVAKADILIKNKKSSSASSQDGTSSSGDAKSSSLSDLVAELDKKKKKSDDTDSNSTASSTPSSSSGSPSSSLSPLASLLQNAANNNASTESQGIRYSSPNLSDKQKIAEMAQQLGIKIDISKVDPSRIKATREQLEQAFSVVPKPKSIGVKRIEVVNSLGGAAGMASSDGTVQIVGGSGVGVIVHEFGHQAHWQSDFPWSKTNIKPLSSYGATNEMENRAEQFRIFMTQGASSRAAAKKNGEISQALKAWNAFLKKRGMSIPTKDIVPNPEV